MNWYLQSTQNSDVVKSTRIRLARNLREFKFNLKTEQEIENLENKIKEILYNLGYGLKFFKLKNMDNITNLSLVEKNLISKEFAKDNLGSILINDDENICIMIGGEDHLKIQVFNSGLDLENTLNLAIEIDEKIEENLQYATNQKYGYLTACPNNVGTALKASVILHLPALSKTGNAKKLLDAISRFGINVKSLTNSIAEENIQDMYQISNNQTLGITEKEIIENIKAISEKIIEQERIARKILTKNQLELEDMVYRSYGILTNCKKISTKEMQSLLSNIKLGTDLGILNELTDLKVQKIYLLTKNANLQKYLGSKLDYLDRDVARAKIIKDIVNE